MIRAEHEGGITRLVLSRPDKRNALTPHMLDTLRAHASDAARSGAVVLCGEGPVFCAGFDLGMCAEAPDGSAMRALLTGLSGVIRALRDLPIPVVAAVQGAAIAGGCALLGGADIVVCDRRAKLGYPVLRIGVSPAVSDPFLRLAVGDGPCRTRLLDPDLITGEQAARLGLVHDLVDRPEDVTPRALDWARTLAGKPREAFSATKAWLREIESITTADRALEASLALTGSDEEQRLLAAAARRT